MDASARGALMMKLAEAIDANAPYLAVSSECVCFHTSMIFQISKLLLCVL